MAFGFAHSSAVRPSSPLAQREGTAKVLAPGGLKMEASPEQEAPAYTHLDQPYLRPE